MFLILRFNQGILSLLGFCYFLFLFFSWIKRLCVYTHTHPNLVDSWDQVSLLWRSVLQFKCARFILCCCVFSFCSFLFFIFDWDSIDKKLPFSLIFSLIVSFFNFTHYKEDSALVLAQWKLLSRNCVQSVGNFYRICNFRTLLFF